MEIKLTSFSHGGGCGCKIAPAVLEQILEGGSATSSEKLLVGNSSRDDAAAYDLGNGEALISTTDFFMPIVDDPYEFGRVAAANAISDVYAMGGKPVMALAVLGWPVEKIDVAHARRVLEGARAVCDEARVPVAGGHSIDSAEPIFGLSVSGLVKVENLKKNDGAREGDLLFLTKPLGTGILATALKRGNLKEEHYSTFISGITSLNKCGYELGFVHGVHALTDITGFGLLGHLIEMCEGAGVSAEISYSAIAKYEGVEEYLAQRMVPDATYRNWNSYSKKVSFEKGVNVMEAFNLLPDPQTNGGLLISVSPEDAGKVRDILSAANLSSYLEPMGRITSPCDKTVNVVL